MMKLMDFLPEEMRKKVEVEVELPRITNALNLRKANLGGNIPSLLVFDKEELNVVLDKK